VQLRRGVRPRGAGFGVRPRGAGFGVRPRGAGFGVRPRATWRFSVTLSSPYDTPQRYADAWRVLDGNDTELGIRVLGHDHANEQPFTRSQSGIAIADGTEVVYVEGRDQANGWSGQRFAFSLPR